MSGGGGAEDAAEVQETLKEGERILGPTRRPDGSLRKPIRIRAGYVPQDEVAIFQSNPKWKKEMSAVPPGYDQDAESKPKSKSAKRNERKKEKRRQQIRMTEAQQQKTLEVDMKPEQLDKVAKLQGWCHELKLLEDNKSQLRSSMKS